MEFIKVDDKFKDKEKLYLVNDEAFPKNEKIPSKKIINYCLKFNCDFWAVYEKEEFVGFIVVLPDKEFQIAYIWLLAVDSRYRSKGLGTKILQKTNKKYNKFKLVLHLKK